MGLDYLCRARAGEMARLSSRQVLPAVVLALAARILSVGRPRRGLALVMAPVWAQVLALW